MPNRIPELSDGNWADWPARNRLVLTVARVVLALRHPTFLVRFTMKPGYPSNPAALQRLLA